MRNKFERILVALLLSISVLLGLSFWLNMIYGFNIFNAEHWAELSKLQVEQIPISNGFYISIAVAIFILVFGLCFIYFPLLRSPQIKKPEQIQNIQLQVPQIAPKPEKEIKKEIQSFEPKAAPIPSRPPRLNLPVNMAEIVHKRIETNTAPKIVEQPKEENNTYDETLAKIFTDGGYIVKPNPTISGLQTNLFAIAADEILWMGAVNADTAAVKSAVDKLNSIFQETLPDITINVNAFVLDLNNNQTPNDSILVFNSVEEVKKFVSELPPVWPKDMSEADQENFDAYSEYIDTIIQYVKSMRL